MQAAQMEISFQQKMKGHQKSKFSQEEDQKLASLVNQFGENSWNVIASFMDGRNIRQCRERWRHHLSPSVSNAPWSTLEDYILDQKYAEYGPQWKRIAEFFPNRTYINIKNRFLLKQRHIERISSQMAEISSEFLALKYVETKALNNRMKSNKININNEYQKIPVKKSISIPESPKEIVEKECEQLIDPAEYIFNEGDMTLYDFEDDYYRLIYGE
ncbi:Myb-like DNA-binding domain containing protein [Tritrichomonas foetus]|uniref:Myb-like DNA-binding domain containing protein n=1 Tax=Tritrichomonas foetus TaxID=1144522 RepID=A0A1J4KP94_9EUKA|nr:Myb-like DNA-binding domain containing protein [Tritrichomonas foetus]|eukprot:OHT13111.1 Myb-like DNA-binding domain containing protein [Tritrichomonas foetus]